ncbi:MAG: ThiF family adenylyltransferase [Kiritimatiellae bacterium]|nr:ThiF family adenylyltransferase [Kiritimatiellia bacterium]
MIVYLNKEELMTLPDTGVADGVACEWEGEEVVHLHARPPRHAYGKVSPCRFIRGGTGELPPAGFCVRYEREGDGVKATAFLDGKELPLNFIPSRSELFSRSKGILEVGALAQKRVMIVGLGSFGGQIAVELAKAGVGAFALLDFDRMELHNLSRHICSVQDLGRLKTDAVADAILGKNPYAEVERFPVDINREPVLLDRETARADLVICATDNNTSRFNLTNALLRRAKPCLYGRAVTRAEGGDVFRYRPGGPCYNCLIGNGWFESRDEEITDEASARRSGRIAAYVSPEDASAMVQVGLSADIEPICNLMVKLALVELSRGLDTGLAQLEDELVYDYYMWANRRERRHANWAPFPNAAAKPTILRWYGARIARNDGCAVCGGHAELDTGDEIESRLGDMGDTSGINLDEVAGQGG